MSDTLSPGRRLASDGLLLLCKHASVQAPVARGADQENFLVAENEADDFDDDEATDTDDEFSTKARAQRLETEQRQARWSAAAAAAAAASAASASLSAQSFLFTPVCKMRSLSAAAASTQPDQWVSSSAFQQAPPATGPPHSGLTVKTVDGEALLERRPAVAVSFRYTFY